MLYLLVVTMIKLTEVGKSFGSNRALEAVTLEVKPGEIVGLVGPDGAGKTTLMRIICGLITADQGEVVRQGEFGYMPQRFSLYGELSVMENIKFFGALYLIKPEEIARRAAEILQITRLTPFVDRPAEQLSGGMKQKLALTVALITRPPLLLLDEPTYGVDPESRKDFWRILYQLNREGMTVLVSTPYMDEAELCHRVAFLDNRLLVVDTPPRLRDEFPYLVIEIIDGGRNADFTEHDFIFDYSIYGDRFRLLLDQTKRPNEDLLTLIKPLVAANAQIVTVRPGMEDVFVSLTKGR
ncbi:MAG: ABC transporter ATP-binding protein [Methylocystaceae bacterium]